MPIYVQQRSSLGPRFRCTHSGTVGRCSILLVVMPHFVEVVLVQLSDKAREVAVFEVLRED